MFENFPYANLHQLNLDWIIDLIQDLHDNAVLSVNGQTGEVILYQGATVQLPDIEERSWTIIRNARNVRRGIKFDADGNAYIVSGNSLAAVFTPENPPSSAQITYDQYIRLTTLTGEQLHNWNIFRTLNGTSTGIQFEDNGDAYIIFGSNRYKLYSTKEALPQAVTSVNGQTGAVELYSESNGAITLPAVNNDNIDAWSISRTINNIPVTLYIDTEGNVFVTAGSNEYRLVNSEELEDLAEDVSSLKSAISTKAPVIIGSASGSIATFSDGADDMPVKELTVQIDPVQAGSGDPSPDNVRPISGWTGAKVMRTGKNLFNNFPQRTETINGVTFTRNADGSVQITGTASGAAYFNYYTWVEFANTPLYALKGKTVRLVGGNSNIRFTISYRKNSSSAASDTHDSGNHPTITLPTDGTFQLYVALRILSGVTVNETIVPMLLSPDELDTTPALYQGETYDIAFPTSAGTVYGGTLTVNKDGSGTLVMDRAIKNVLASDITNSSSSFAGRFFTTGQYITDRVPNTDILCNAFIGSRENNSTVPGVVYISTGKQLIFNTPFNTINDFKTFIENTGLIVIYTISNTTTYNLTAEQINTLLGINNIWADTGNVSVEYPADTKLYIDNKITELQALVLENISNS